IRDHIDRRVRPAPQPDPAATAAALLAGVGIGAAAMYFLDPDHGAQRRAALLAPLGTASEAASDAVGSASQAVTDRARSMTGGGATSSDQWSTETEPTLGGEYSGGAGSVLGDDLASSSYGADSTYGSSILASDTVVTTSSEDDELGEGSERSSQGS
ncbi:MAG: hypothetical protein H0X16_07395, partial [Chloroflexi bacterium]|nr:hypothetical protein [Chloroflexota bacterium]